MRTSRQRYLPFATIFALGLVAPPVDAAQTGAHVFDADISPTRPIVLKGSLEIGAQNVTALLFLLGAESKPFTYETTAQMSLQERRWQSFSSENDFGPNSGVISGSYRETSTVIASGKVRLRAENSTAGILAIAAPGAVSTTLPTSCQGTVGAVPERVAIGSGVEVARLWGSIRLECAAPAAVLPTAARVYVYGVEVRLEVDSASGSLSQSIVTGSSARKNASMKTVFDHTDRVLVLSSTTASTVNLPPQKFTLWTTALAVHGRIEIPSSRGVARWGDWEARPQVPPLGPAGNFLVTTAASGPQATGGALITGFATNLPPTIRAASPAADPVAAILLVAIPITLGLANWPRWSRLGAPLFGLFSRLTKSEALIHERRRVLLDLVVQNPGIQIQQLACLAGLSRRVTDYHVDVLVREHLVKSYRFGRRSSLHAQGQDLPREEVERLRRIPNPTARAILDFVKNHRSSAQSDVAKALGLSQPCVSVLLRWLASKGHVSVTSAGRRRTYDA